VKTCHEPELACCFPNSDQHTFDDVSNTKFEANTFDLSFLIFKKVDNISYFNEIE
jgi:hypothetical protein